MTSGSTINNENTVWVLQSSASDEDGIVGLFESYNSIFQFLQQQWMAQWQGRLQIPAGLWSPSHKEFLVEAES
jgi:hypothetical protein